MAAAPLCGCLGFGATLEKALQAGDAAQVRKFLAEAGPDGVPLTFGGAGTIMHLAARGGNAEVLELVWGHVRSVWPDQSAHFQRRSNPFQRLSGSAGVGNGGSGSHMTMQQFINLVNAHGQTALMEACQRGNGPCVRLLLDQVTTSGAAAGRGGRERWGWGRGAQQHVYRKAGHGACRGVGRGWACASHGTRTSRFRFRPLLLAPEQVVLRHPSCPCAVLTQGANCWIRDRGNCTCLHHAALHGKPDSIDAVLSHPSSARPPAGMPPSLVKWVDTADVLCRPVAATHIMLPLLPQFPVARGSSTVNCQSCCVRAAASV